MRTFTSSMLNSWSATHKQSLLWCSAQCKGEGSWMGVSHYICPWPPYEWFWQEFCWMRGRKHGQFFYCLILFSAKKESPISFLAIGNMTMCKILKDLSKELLPKGEKSTVFMIKTTFGNWNFFDLLPYLWNEKKLSIFRPYSSLKRIIN